MPAGHRVAHCAELLAIIFTYLESPPGRLPDTIDDLERRRGLASAARAARAISVYALDALWTSLDDVEHLLSILPQFRLYSVPQWHGETASVSYKTCVRAAIVLETDIVVGTV